MKNYRKTLKPGADSFYLNQKLRLLIVISALLSISFFTFSQPQKVTLKKDRVGLEIILKEIQHQTGLNYIFNHEELPEKFTITIDVTNETVEKVLETCLKNTGLTFKIVDQIIVITPNAGKKPAKLTQVIRGNVLDAEALTPLPFATIAINTTDPVMGVVTNEEGLFRIENVPIGRHNLRVSFVGYETQILPELMVTTGKEIVLNIKLREQIAELKEVHVRAFTKKDKPLNSMATASARTFSVEEARRYAGGWDDPGRLAASFAGITAESSRDNTIIIRGNSPKGLLWRLEGIEISNPNHFANLGTYGGGGISALSALVLGNSDFYTSAFPAEYGNATSGVFDIRLRSGNNEKFEHAVQLGTLGVDLSSEGPLKKKSRASYLFNYRYSTFGLMKEIFPEDLKHFLPVYQDLCFKLNIPAQNSGIFSIWGLAANDGSSLPAKEDTAEWGFTFDRIDNKVSQGFAAGGANHRYVFKKNAWLNTSLAVSGDYMDYVDKMLDYDLIYHDYNTINVKNYKYTFSSTYNHKFSARHSNRSGISLENMHYNIDLKFAPVLGRGLIGIAQEKGASNFMQVFSQSKVTLSTRFHVNAGIHGQYFTLNNEFVMEPRLGLIYNLDNSHSLSLAYGKHSRIEPLSLYFTKVSNEGGYMRPNKDLRVTKAHHLVFAYDKSLNDNLRIKVEPYIQFLYDVPVIPDSNYSVLNLELEWYSFDKELINTGTGKNIGIDMTLERFLNNGYYYLVTASLFDSRYKGDDGVEYNTRFNTHYVVNVLYGKEWIVGKGKNKILGANGKFSVYGGRRTTPINQEQSVIVEDVVYQHQRLYDNKEQDKYYLNATINYRINKKKHASIWSFQMVNMFLVKESFGDFYNYKKKQVEPWELAVPTPNLSYKIEF